MFQYNHNRSINEYGCIYIRLPIPGKNPEAG